MGCLLGVEGRVLCSQVRKFIFSPKMFTLTLNSVRSQGSLSKVGKVEKGLPTPR